MRLSVDCQKLWQATEEITRAASKGLFQGQLTIETISENSLVVHRYSSDTYAEYEIPCRVEEPGKVTIGGLAPLAYMFGQADVHSTDTSLIFNGDEVPHTELRRAENDFLDTRMTYGGQPIAIPPIAKNTRWAAIKGHSKHGYVFIVGCYLACYTEVYASICTLDSPVSEKIIAFPVEALSLIKENPRILPENNHVWFIEGDLRVRLSTKETSDWLTKLASTMEGHLESMPRLVHDRSELLNVIGYLHSVSSSNIIRSGLAYMEFGEDEVRFEGAATEEAAGEWGDIQTSTIGEGEASISPEQMQKSVAAIEGEEVTIGIEGNFVIVSGGRIINTMARISDFWRRKDEESEG